MRHPIGSHPGEHLAHFAGFGQLWRRVFQEFDDFLEALQKEQTFGLAKQFEQPPIALAPTQFLTNLAEQLSRGSVFRIRQKRLVRVFQRSGQISLPERSLGQVGVLLTAAIEIPAG